MFAIVSSTQSTRRYLPFKTSLPRGHPIRTNSWASSPFLIPMTWTWISRRKMLKSVISLPPPSPAFIRVTSRDYQRPYHSGPLVGAWTIKPITTGKLRGKVIQRTTRSVSGRVPRISVRPQSSQRTKYVNFFAALLPRAALTISLITAAFLPLSLLPFTLTLSFPPFLLGEYWRVVEPI